MTDQPVKPIRRRVPQRMDVQFTVPMTRKTRATLEAVANVQETTVAHIIRKAIKDYLISLGVEEEGPTLSDTLKKVSPQS